jgi:phosphopantetheinyl transferase
MTRKIDYISILKKYFNSNEINKVNTLNDFFILWTKKEALFKLLETDMYNFNSKKFDTSNNIYIKKEKVFFKTFSFLENYVLSISYLSRQNFNLLLRRKVD